VARGARRLQRSLARGLTTPAIDALTVPASKGERHANAYWLKEGVFRLIRKQLAAARAAEPGRAAGLTASSAISPGSTTRAGCRVRRAHRGRAGALGAASHRIGVFTPGVLT